MSISGKSKASDLSSTLISKQQIVGGDEQSDNFHGKGQRVMIYSHDTFGLGHLRRCLKISKALANECPEISILLVTGSPLVDRFELPPSVDYVKLPAVRKVGPERYEARSLGTSYRRILSLRTGILLESAKAYQPDLLLVDHSPQGMKGEMLPTLRWIKDNLRECSVMLGLRDIIDDPATVINQWKTDNLYDEIHHLYHHILVYGSRELFDLTEDYKFTEELKYKTIFCNFVCDQDDSGQNENLSVSESGGEELIPAHDMPLVVVTIGGGDGAGEAVIGTYLKMLRERLTEVNFQTVILGGPFLSPDLVAQFRHECEGLPVTLASFTNNTRTLFEQSELIVATAGYNTVTEILLHGRRAILIPRVMHRQEQLIRAIQLSDMGIVSFIHPDKITIQQLFMEITKSLSDNSQPVREAREKNRIPLDGASNVANVCKSLLKEKINQVKSDGTNE